MRITSACAVFVFLASVCTIWTVNAEDFSGMSYLDNGKIRIGVNLDIGGAITYLSESGSDENIINTHDWGRQIQMSFYSGPNPFKPDGKEPNPVWSFLGWNPIQSGDTYGNRSKVVAHRNDDSLLYVKCIPMQWPLDDEPGECTFEVWMRLEGNSVQVRSKLNNARSDHTQYRGRSQELPALYSNGTYYRLYTCDGDAPYTGDAFRRIAKVWDTRFKPNEVPGGPWDNWIATENWAALVNEVGRGVGIWTPGTYSFTGGFAGTPGSGGPKDGSTGYISPIRAQILDHNIEYEYGYTLIVGELEDIRAFVYEKATRQTLPDYTFKRDRQSWTLSDCEDEGWPITGAWSVRLSGTNPRLVGSRSFWHASEMPTVYVRASFETGREKATLAWEGFNGSSSGRVEFDVVSDGKVRTYPVVLRDAANYDGVCTRLSLVPQTDGTVGRGVMVESISFQRKD